jgi:rhamnosyltransferase
MTSSPKRVAVVLSTYEGENFLPALLDSLKKQKPSFTLFWRDDGSRDNSANIVRDFVGIEKVECREILGNIGAAKSFLHLLSHVTDFDYISFCDQDDVWDSDKIELAIEKLAVSSDNPRIYASRVRILDTEKIWPTKVPSLSTANALFENVLIGCTLVVNKKALEILQLTPAPDDILHDAWIYLLGAEFMNITYDDIPHISYRIHNDNATGIESMSSFISLVTLKRILRLSKIRLVSEKKIRALRELHELENHAFDNSKNFDELLFKKGISRIYKVRNVRLRQDNIENMLFRIMWVLNYL